MTEDKLHQLFQELKFEDIETSAKQINQWIESNRISKPKGTHRLIKIFIGILSLSVLSIYLVNLTHVHSTIDKTVPLYHFDTHQLSKPKLEIKFSANHRRTTNAQKKQMDSLPILEGKMIETIQIDKLPFLRLKKEYPNPQSVTRNEKSKKWLSSIVLSQPKNGAVMDSSIRFLNELVILDSIKNFRSIKQFFIDDRTSYLFMYDNYIVISYQYRGANFYRSGKVYETGELLLDGKPIQIIGFIGDNSISPAHYGERFYLGIDTKNDGLRQVIFYNYLWTPTTFLKGHNASPAEKGNLIKMSNSEKRL